MQLLTIHNRTFSNLFSKEMASFEELEERFRKLNASYSRRLDWTAIIFHLKSIKGTIEKVQSLFSDVLMWQYNCEGKAGKRALLPLKTADLTIAAFASIHVYKILSIEQNFGFEDEESLGGQKSYL
ncbi:uncharacterized protein [Bactrocera oleae]|uniref:uncharacterized protein n=1 Tax=Bactrocera oleae TaxID=104688 RepID=UPI0006B6D0E4